MHDWIWMERWSRNEIIFGAVIIVGLLAAAVWFYTHG